MGTMTSAQFAAMTGGKPGDGSTTRAAGRKYRNVRTEYDGQVYDSKAEAARARELDLLVAAGEVRFWIRQPVVRLAGSVTYRPDFLVIAADGRAWFEDVKGAEVQRFRVICDLWARHGPAPLRVISKGGGRTIEPASQRRATTG